jgi:hypothetical protein
MGEANGMYRHGRYTNDAIARRRELNGWIKAMGELAEEIT